MAARLEQSRRRVEFCDVVLTTEPVEGDPPRVLAQSWLSWRGRQAA